MQDNDSKHRSISTKKWMTEVGMLDSVMVTPASSPDLNAIENVWATLKDNLKRHVKPTTKAELVNGIRLFWESLTPANCARYIDHVQKVLPVVVLNAGGPSGY
ncbi:MAG: transposase [Sedimenticola sp.]